MSRAIESTKGYSVSKMIKRHSILLFFLATSYTVWSAEQSRFQIEDAHPDRSGVTLRTAVGVMRIEFCSERAVHVVASHTGQIPPAKVPVVTQPCSEKSVRVRSGKDQITISTPKISVLVNRANGAVAFQSPEGKTLLAEPSQGGKQFDVPGTYEAQNWQVKQEFRLQAEEALYGLGQHQEGFFDLRNIPIRLLQANTNIAIPFLLSTNGYGLLWNNPSLTDFDPPTEVVSLDQDGNGTFQSGPEGDYGFLLSGNFRDRLRLTVDQKDIIDLKNMWLPLSAGAKVHLAANTKYTLNAATGGHTRLEVRRPSDTMGFRSEAGDAVDYYFLYGPELTNVIAAYRDLTGTAPLLPRWAYGFWQCRERYSSQQQILDTAGEFRDRKIPVDVLVQDWQYWGKYGWNAMRFDERNYPNPGAMMASLHQKDLHLVISVWAKFGVETDVDRNMVSDGLVLKSAAATGEPGEAKERENWADLFNPRAQRAFWSDLNRNLFGLGLDGWWLDASEPEGDPLKTDETYLGPGTTVRNAFPLFETSAVYSGQRVTSTDKRVVILSRSAFAGQQRNASIAWSGDISANWDTLRRQVTAGLEFGMSGFPYWTTDIGGFFRPRDQYTSVPYHELLIRWFQFGAFCPIFRIHGYQSETEMWKYGPEVERVLREYDDFRYRLLPYIYSTAWGVTNRNETMMQALPLVYPSQPSVRSIRDEFLLGDSLLISPVLTEGANAREVTLPGGEDWTDFWSGEKTHGGQTVRVEAPLDRVPIFVKAGSIVPLGPEVQSAAEPIKKLEIRVYPGKDAHFLLYQDSGDGYGYEHGERATIPMHWDDVHNRLDVGRRSGSYPGMPQGFTLNVVRVNGGRGVGDLMMPDGNHVLSYKGDPIAVSLPEASQP
ncbi:DUF5110 domain-containing protein [Acidobacteria bacterium AB60]|nr:DUF5110 domain-containing protein [Acidobacteria bacterium AB60]